MASNIFSRLVPGGRSSRSFYEDLRAGDDLADVEERAGLALDDENLNHPFRDDDLDDADGLGAEGSRLTVGSADAAAAVPAPFRRRKEHGARWLGVDDDADDDVPESLLVEAHEAGPVLHPIQRRQPPLQARSGAVPGPATRKSRAQWETAQSQQRLHQDDGLGAAGHGHRGQPGSVMANVGPDSDREKAMWRWVNVSNLDIFIRDVYDYYQACGMWCILTSRILHLM